MSQTLFIGCELPNTFVSPPRSLANNEPKRRKVGLIRLLLVHIFIWNVLNLERSDDLVSGLAARETIGPSVAPGAAFTRAGKGSVGRKRAAASRRGTRAACDWDETGRRRVCARGQRSRPAPDPLSQRAVNLDGWWFSAQRTTEEERIKCERGFNVCHSLRIAQKQILTLKL